MVRHFVRQHRNGGDHAQTQVGHERRGNQHAVTKAVHAVPREHSPGSGHSGVLVRMAMRGVTAMVIVCNLMGVMVLVAVVPQLGFVQQKEKNQTRQQSHEQIMGTGLTLKGLGQQMHEGRGQKRARRHAEHVLGVTGQHAKTQQCRDPDASNAGGQRTQDNSHQNHSKKRFLFKGWRLF